MTLAELAGLVDADPKWVLNTLTLLHRRRGRYSLDLAQRLAVTRILHHATGMPFGRAFDLSDKALRGSAGNAPVTLQTDDPAVSLTIDVPRILSSLSVRYSAWRTTLAPRQRGRPAARRRDPIVAAREWGLDTALLVDNLRKSPAERLRQLDGMVSFAHRARQRGTGAA